MRDLTEILKGHEGITLYSPLTGKVVLEEIDNGNSYPILVKTAKEDEYCFTSDGRFLNIPNGECMLFPAEDQRDWSKWNRKEYKVTFSNTSDLYTAEELKNFINTAIINNKDVNEFSVERIKQ